jgi:hypothetical protein
MEKKTENPTIEEMLDVAFGLESMGLTDEAEDIRAEVRTMRAGAVVIGLPVGLLK